MDVLFILEGLIVKSLPISGFTFRCASKSVATSISYFLFFFKNAYNNSYDFSLKVEFQLDVRTQPVKIQMHILAWPYFTQIMNYSLGHNIEVGMYISILYQVKYYGQTRIQIRYGTCWCVHLQIVQYIGQYLTYACVQ